MKSYQKKLLSLFLFLIFMWTLVGCSKPTLSSTSDPSETIKSYLNALKQSDFQKSTTFLSSGGDDKDKLKFDDAEQENLVKKIFSKLDYTMDKPAVDGDKATVNVKITSIDMDKISEKVIGDLVTKYFNEAASGKEVDENGQKAETMKALVSAINDANADKLNTDVKVTLVKDKKGWLIEPSQDLSNAVTGNLLKVDDNSIDSK